jgi:4-hydroxy-2-oxoheptanedioate aldolase
MVIKKALHLFLVNAIMLIFFIACGTEKTETKKTSTWEPKRINKCIELLEAGQPIYYAAGYGGYEEGKAMAQTWGDYIIYNMEHNPLDFTKLRGFMQGLFDGGPTPSGHLTPTVIAIVPVLGINDNYLEGGAWMIQQALAQGVHGLHLVRARDPEAVQLLVQNSRYPIHKQGIDTLGEGLRGFGSHTFASKIWGISREEYLRKADVWPLNPDGELMLGIKIEDQAALKNAELTLAIPGIAFAEHGPRDMGLSYGYLEGRADPPVPAEVDAAGEIVLGFCKKFNIAFLDNVLPDNVEDKIKKGVMIGAGRRQDSAEVGRAFTKRQMPW